jgi:hypothetical protein
MTQILRQGEDPRVIHPACIYRGLYVGLTECPG